MKFMWRLNDNFSYIIGLSPVFWYNVLPYTKLFNDDCETYWSRVLFRYVFYYKIIPKVPQLVVKSQFLY